jgi:hypothetical protein
MEFPVHATVEDLAAHIASMYDPADCVVSDDVQLIYEGVRLNRAVTVQHASLSSGSVVRVVVRRPGGGVRTFPPAAVVRAVEAPPMPAAEPGFVQLFFKMPDSRVLAMSCAATEPFGSIKARVVEAYPLATIRVICRGREMSDDATPLSAEVLSETLLHVVGRPLVRSLSVVLLSVCLLSIRGLSYFVRTGGPDRRVCSPRVGLEPENPRSHSCQLLYV